MSDNVVQGPFPGDSKGRGGGGPEDPILEAREGRLEDDMKDVKADLKEVRRELRDMHGDLREIKGMLQRTPDVTQMWRMVIGTWIAGAGVVALMVRLLAP